MDWTQILSILSAIAGVGWSVEKLLRLLDRLLPESVTWDNNLADIIANILKSFFPKKKVNP